MFQLLHITDKYIRMHVETLNGVQIYTPTNFEDLYELSRLLKDVEKPVIVNCSKCRILPSHFISVVLVHNDHIILVEVSHVALEIFKTININTKINYFKTVDNAIRYIKSVL